MGLLRKFLALALVVVVAYYGFLVFEKNNGKSKVVVLASNDPASLAGGMAISEALGAELVTFPMGEFSGGSLSRVLSLSPGEVILVGEKALVPAEYSSRLAEKGVKVKELVGKDRFETSDLVTRWLAENVKEWERAYIVRGWNEGLIIHITQDDPGAVVMLVNPHHDLVNAIHEKTGLSKAKVKSASAGGGSYGRSVYVDPTLFNGSPPCNCTPMDVNLREVTSLSAERLENISGTLPGGELKTELDERVKKARELISEGKVIEAEEIIENGLSLAYGRIESLESPGPTQSGSGSTD